MPSVCQNCTRKSPTRCGDKQTQDCGARLGVPDSAVNQLQFCCGVSQMRDVLLVICLLPAAVGVLYAQHGTAPNGYFPMGYNGDTWTGEVSMVNDDNREITLVYTTSKKTEKFVGVLQQGYKVKLKDGSLAELRVSTIPTGTRLKVYYMAKDRKVNGQKEKFYEIFRMEFPPH
jgi:hypothetical protein